MKNNQRLLGSVCWSDNHSGRMGSLARQCSAGVIAVVAAAVLSGCGADGGTGATSAEDAELAKIGEQISQANTELAAHEVPLKIVSYEEVKGLVDDGEVERFRTGALDGAALVPSYEGMDMSQLRLSTIDDRVRQFRAQPAPAGLDVRSAIAEQALPEVALGQRVLEITWDSAERGEFKTRCAFDADGLRYDSIMTNFAFLELSDSPDAATPEASHVAGLSTQSEAAAASRTPRTTTFLDGKMKWIFGKLRGEAWVTHGVLIDSKKGIIDQNGGGGDHMSVGSSAHKYHAIYLHKDAAKMAGAVALATPTVSFTITYDAKALKFNIGTSGLGSRVTGTQEHTWYQ